MREAGYDGRSYAIAALAGAVGGGLFVAIVTRALPRMVSRIMSGMMQSVMARVGEGGCDPAEI